MLEKQRGRGTCLLDDQNRCDQLFLPPVRRLSEYYLVNESWSPNVDTRLWIEIYCLRKAQRTRLAVHLANLPLASTCSHVQEAFA